jgi:hypothetical protein
MAPRILDKVVQVHRPPRQAKAGIAPGQGGVPGRMGQPAFVATDKQRAEVMKYVACGFTHDSISVIMAIPANTLDRHFAWELTNGKTMVDAKILGGIVDMALDHHPTMSIFWAKAKAGWRDGRGSDDQGAAASPVFAINISNCSPSTPDTISNGSPSAPDTGHRISITALPRQREEEP